MWNVEFIKGMNNISVAEPNPLHYSGSGDYYMHDVRIRWNFLENTNASFGVNNLFGIDPPYVFNSSYNTSTALFGEAVVGRYFFLRVTTKL
jgi:outer membrane receptor protein involved in Fe transport